MKGDFSFDGFDSTSDYTGVRHQQGRVLLDRDWNDAQEIDAFWRSAMAGDAFGLGVLAVPATSAAAFQVLSATADAAGVHIELNAGRAWASGLAVSLDADNVFDATYVEPPLAPGIDPDTIRAGVRDAVVLEVFEDTVSGFQDPTHLIEPALGGLDTTERVQAFATVKLLRLDENQDCGAVSALIDDPGAKGKLRVTPSQAIKITGDCPLEAGGGYTGMEHFLYRIEIAEPDGGNARFKWSQFNGGLVGRGSYTAKPGGKGTVVITANDQAINTCGVASFWLEALNYEAGLGVWTITFTATAKRTDDGVLNLTGVTGTWPAGDTAFFRLWNGIEEIATFATGAPVEFNDGLQLTFDPQAADNSNYRPGDYWTFPVRASGAAFDPPIWPIDAPPAGVVYRRMALGVVRWQDDKTASWDNGDIDDCRHVFRSLTQQKICCSYIVGDGTSSFGDFNSIELALRHLPAAGGELCLLPGLHTCNAVIDKRANVTIRGCGARTRVMPRERTLDKPIFTVRDSSRIEILHIDFVTLGGTAIWIEGSRPGLCDDIVIAHHRILAFVHAVFARNASNLNIVDNRIRMFDKVGGLAAIDVSAEDVLIERNDIALVPAEQTPPVDPRHPVDPINPVDPCARLNQVYARPLKFTNFVNSLWAQKFSLASMLILQTPYRAQAGIQVRGGSERVRILDNYVVGGAGHGITLGTAVIATPPAAPDQPAPDRSFTVEFGSAGVMGRVTGPDGPASGIQITLTRTSDDLSLTKVSDADGNILFRIDAGTYAVSEAAPGLEIDSVDAKVSVAQQILTVVVENPVRFNVTLAIKLKASAAPPAADTGFLYEIRIERNYIAAMGLCGIGAPVLVAAEREAALDRARRVLGAPVIGLGIRDNRVVNNLRNPFDAALNAVAAVRGLGGISLGLVDDTAITGNRVEGNGRSGANPVCGIFIQYGEALEIARNVILDNGVAPAQASIEIQDGLRGGVVIGLAGNFGLFTVLRRGAGDAGAAASAARVLANHVEQPVGCALLMRAFGPAMVNDNVFMSERSAVGGVDALAGTVLISNLAGLENVESGTVVKAQPVVRAQRAPAVAAAAAAGALVEDRPLNIAETAFRPIAVEPAVIAAALLPSGSVMFNDNQTRAGAAHVSPITQLVIGNDDVSFAANQCHTDQTGKVFANTMVSSPTLRATANRLRERAADTNASLLTVSSRANDTSLNQGDHCILAYDSVSGPASVVPLGNQVLIPGERCAVLGRISANVFRL